MRINTVSFDGPPPIDGYGPGFFRVDGVMRPGALAMLPSGAAGWAGLADIAPFLAEADRIDVLLLGMGAEIRVLDPVLRTALDAAGIGVEIMATAPACRTYNVLLSEGRRIAAGLLPV